MFNLKEIVVLVFIYEYLFFQDEQKAAAMVGLTEEGPPEVDTEEVKHMVPGVKWLLCVLSLVKILFLS